MKHNDKPHPDQELPDQPHPDQGLPGEQPKPDNTLPGERPKRRKEEDEEAQKKGQDLRPLTEKADPGHQYDAVKAQQAWVAHHDQRRSGRDIDPDAQPVRLIGDIVHYTWDDGEVYPAMVMKQHDEDHSLDLKIFLGYAQSTMDKHHVLFSELGDPGTFMDQLPKEDRDEKMKAALDKHNEAEEKRSEEIKKQVEADNKKDAKALSDELAALQKRTADVGKRIHEHPALQ